MCRVSELGLGTTRKLHHHGPGSSGRAGEEKHATHARARTADTDRGDAGCCMRSVGRSTGFSHATLRKKTGWSEMPTHFALWCVPYRLPLPLPHIFYLDDIYALLIWLEATFMSWSHIWPMNATVCLPLYLSDLPPFHSISAPPSLPPSLPPSSVPCSAAIVSHETFLMEQVSFGVRRTSPTDQCLTALLFDQTWFKMNWIIFSRCQEWIPQRRCVWKVNNSPDLKKLSNTMVVGPT